MLTLHNLLNQDSSRIAALKDLDPVLLNLLKEKLEESLFDRLNLKFELVDGPKKMLAIVFDLPEQNKFYDMFYLVEIILTLKSFNIVIVIGRVFYSNQTQIALMLHEINVATLRRVVNSDYLKLCLDEIANLDLKLKKLMSLRS